MLLLCLTSTEKSKPCLQLSLPTVLLSSSVSQMLLLKTKSFKKSTRLLANIYVPSLSTRLLANIYVSSLSKCNPSLYKTSLVMLSLLMNWKLFLLNSSRDKPLTFLMILVSLNCFLMKMDDIITSLTP